MSDPLWLPRERRRGDSATVTAARIVETVDRHHPETLASLAERLDITEDYLSQRVRELKSAGAIKKAYVVDGERVYDVAPSLSALDDEAAPTAFVDSLRAFDDAVCEQYRAAVARFDGDTDADADELAAVTCRRHEALTEDLKSYCLTAGWPGNRLAADVAAIATRLRRVGTQAAFLTATLADAPEMTGALRADVADAFESGASIGTHVSSILREADLDRIDDVTDRWVSVGRAFDELFERVMVREATDFGPFITVIRALERAVESWVRAGELAVTLHSGLPPDALSPR